MYNKILIAVDLSHKQQLKNLVDEARNFSSDSPDVKFDFLYVDDSGIHKVGSPYMEKEDEQKRKQDTHKSLLALSRELIPDSLNYECHVVHGTVHEQVVAESKRFSSDIIIMMANKPGLSSYFIGSNAERVIRHSECSVLIVRV